MDISREMRALVLERDAYRCQRCGQSVKTTIWYSIQHRKARGTGGVNTPQNLVVLCGSATSRGCHQRSEARDPVMHKLGFWINSWEDEELVPIVRYDGTQVWLLADGGVSYDAPSAA